MRAGSVSATERWLIVLGAGPFDSPAPWQGRTAQGEELFRLDMQSTPHPEPRPQAFEAWGRESKDTGQ